jgi:hypothetical protein
VWNRCFEELRSTLQGGVYGNALQAASIRGHENIVELLLHEGDEHE